MSRLQAAVVVTAFMVWMAGSAVTAATINVPLGNSIQTAIAGASSGDVIVLAAGTYNELIDYSGKNLTIRGQGTSTIINGGRNGTVVTFQSGETSSARLEQVTVTLGAGGGGWPGGVLINGASPTIWNCTITGNSTANGGNGGGIGVWSGSPSISSCAITGNSAGNWGGGIYASNGTPWINGCIITGNSAFSGGGVAMDFATNFTLQNCRIASNASDLGHGLQVNSSTGAVTNCLFDANTPLAGSYVPTGGGAYESNSTVTYSGNVFQNNSTTRGGGICVEDTADGGGGVGTVIRNNVFVGNTATEGGAVCTNVVSRGTNVSAYVRNNTFHNNYCDSVSAAVSVGDGQGTEFSNNIVSNTQGGFGICDVGSGYISMFYNCFWNNALGSYGGNASEHDTGTDIYVNPRFVNPAAGDFHLQSSNAHWHRIGTLVWNTAGHWAKDNYTSPCIDAGAPGSDFSNEPAPNGGRANMGRYGNTAEASKTSYWKTHTPSVFGVNVSRVQTISLEFLRPMNQASVTSHLTVSHPGGNAPGTITWPVANQRLEFTPNSPWLAATQYTVKITSGTLLQSGGALNWEERFVFTTGNGPAPTAWTPTGTGVARDTNISVTFDADMNQASVQAGFRTVPATTGTFSWVGRTMTYNPNGLLLSNRAYTYTVDRSSETTGGAKLGAGFSRSFTTGTTPTTAAVAMVGAASTVGGVTSVTISLTAEATVSASVLNLAGREVAVLPSRSYEAGLQTLLWDGRSLAGTRVPGGRYLIRLEANTEDGQRASCLVPLQR